MKRRRTSKLGLYVRSENEPLWDWAWREAERLNISISDFVALLIENAKKLGYKYGP